MPNTLAQLNSFSNQSYPFEDERAYSITFSANATSNQSVAVAEDVSFTSPVGINITGVISQPGNITYNINTSNIGANAILTWPTLPVSVSSSSPSTGVYRVTGIMDNVIWDQIKNPTILAKDEAANFVYSANIQYPNTANTALTNTWSWTNSVTISNTHSELSNATNFTYDEDIAKTIPGTPTVTDTYAGPLPHTLVITPNVANAVFSLSMAGNTSLDPVTKALTIVDSKANINTGLGNLWLVPYPDYDQTFSLNYSLTNPVSNLNTQVNQTATIANTNADFTMTTSYTFAEDAQTTLIFNMQDSDPTATSYVISVDQTAGTDGTLFVNNTSAGLGNMAGFSGNLIQFNSANITFVPFPDATSNVTLNVNAYKNNIIGNILVANVDATLTCTSTHDEYTVPASVTYVEDTDLTLTGFAITDLATNKQYQSTLALTGNIGNFIASNSVNTGTSITFTGNKTFVNSELSSITFRPDIDGFANSTILYSQTQTSNNIIQASNVSVAINSTGDQGEYSAPASLSVYALEKLSLSGYSITDASATKQYTLSLNQTGTTGSFYLANVSQGNTLTLTGNKTTINSSLSSSSTYWQSATALAASSSIYLNLQRTSPGTANIASNVVCTLDVTIPSVGTTWLGGTYIGIANAAISGGNFYITANPTTSANIAFTTVAKDPSSNQPIGYPLATSNVNGPTATTYLAALNYANATACHNAAVLSEDATAGNYTDWYLPAYKELEWLVTSANYKTTATDYWSSTVTDSGASTKVIYWNESGNVIAERQYIQIWLDRPGGTGTGGSDSKTVRPIRRITKP